MTRYAIHLLGFALAAGAVAATGPAYADTAVWACENGQVYRATYDEQGVTIRSERASYTLRTTRAASGVRFEADGIVFHEKGADAIMTLPDGQTVNCTRRSAQKAADEGDPPGTIEFPVAGRSSGGIVRAGPGRQFARIGSLREGQGVQITTNTRVRWNGYDWFGIRYRGGAGFQWGGLLCSKGRKIRSIHEACDRAATPAR